MITDPLIKSLPGTLKSAAVCGHLRGRLYPRHDRPPVTEDEDHAAAWWLGYYTAKAEAGDEAAAAKALEAADDLGILEIA